MILSVNDAKAAKALKLQYEEWNYKSKQPQKNAFTAWLKKNLDAGYPVTAGFYLKQQGGDADFDHIMIIIGYSVDNSGNVNGIYHNDYYLDEVVYAPDVFSTRNECTMKNPTQPYQYCLPTNVDYGYVETPSFDVIYCESPLLRQGVLRCVCVCVCVCMMVSIGVTRQDCNQGYRRLARRNVSHHACHRHVE